MTAHPPLPQLLKSRGLQIAPKAHVFQSCARWVGRRGAECGEERA